MTAIHRAVFVCIAALVALASTASVAAAQDQGASDDETRQKASNDEKEEERDDDDDDGADEQTTTEAQEQARIEAEKKKILLQQLGARGSDGGSVADILADDSQKLSLEEALENSGGVGIKSSSSESEGSESTGISESRQAQTVADVTAEVHEVDVAADGTMEESAARAVLERRLMSVERCVERAVGSGDVEPPMQADMTLEKTVGTVGRVTRVKTTESAFSASVNNCVTSMSKRIRFPRPEDGAVDVTVVYRIEVEEALDRD
jgi:hypothetical protein